MRGLQHSASKLVRMVLGVRRRVTHALFATHSFEAFGADFGAQVGDKYAAGAAENPQKAYDSIGTDTGVTCGNIEVAKAAGEGFQSPVFSYVNNYAPSHPWPSSPTGCVLAEAPG